MPGPSFSDSATAQTAKPDGTRLAFAGEAFAFGAGRGSHPGGRIRTRRSSAKLAHQKRPRELPHGGRWDGGGNRLQIPSTDVPKLHRFKERSRNLERPDFTRPKGYRHGPVALLVYPAALGNSITNARRLQWTLPFVIEPPLRVIRLNHLSEIPCYRRCAPD
jgi:hypothetical protein